MAATTGQQIGDIKSRTIKIATNLAQKEGFLVNLDVTTDELVGLAVDATKVPFVLLDCVDGSVTPGIGTIATMGRVKVKIGGNVTAGDKLTANGTGLAITTVVNKDNYGLIALHNGVANDVIEALVCFGLISS